MQYLLNTWANYWRSYTVDRSPTTKFIIFAHSRSGSHLFVDLMNCHPDVKCVTEHQLFYKRRGIRSPYRYIDGVSKSVPTAAFGGKINVRQLGRQVNNVVDTVARLHGADWKFIILQRENILDQTISAQVATERRQFHDTSQPTIEQMRITVDLIRLRKKLANKAAINHSVTELLSPYFPLTIVYERDLIGAEVQQTTADRVFAFLGIESVPVQTKYVKTGVYALSDYITNYDEMVQSLQGTEFACFLPGKQKQR